MADHRSFFLDEALQDYVLDHTTAADDVQDSLAAATRAAQESALATAASCSGEPSGWLCWV